MYMKDFVYAGKRLSDYGYIVANVVTRIKDSISLGSNLSFNTVKNNSTFIQRIVNIDYNEPITATFDICKSPNQQNSEIKDNEITFLMRWLNRKRHEEFRPIYEDGSYGDIRYKGSFNISAIYIGGEVVGFTLTFNSNSPFGYSGEKVITHNITQENGTFTYYVDSDEIGYLLPHSVEITCNADGEFRLSNNVDTLHDVVVNNVASGETITIDSKNQIITSDFAHTKLCNDFNYKYPRFVIDEDYTKNVFTVSIPCTIKIAYRQIRKVGIIV